MVYEIEYGTARRYPGNYTNFIARKKENYDKQMKDCLLYTSCTLSDEELCREANKWELSHGGISGRTATQFVNYIMANN